MRFRGDPGCDHTGATDSAPDRGSRNPAGRREVVTTPHTPVFGDGKQVDVKATPAPHPAQLNRAREVVEVGWAEVRYALDVWAEFEEATDPESDEALTRLTELLEDSGLSHEGQAFFASAVQAVIEDDLPTMQGSPQYSAGVQRGAVFGVFVGLLARQVGEEAAELFSDG